MTTSFFSYFGLGLCLGIILGALWGAVYHEQIVGYGTDYLAGCYECKEFTEAQYTKSINVLINAMSYECQVETLNVLSPKVG